MGREATAAVSVNDATSGQATPRSLEGLHGTVEVPPASAGFWRQLRAFFGPAILVSVGYMDPGSRATSPAAGAKYRYHLLWAPALASLMAFARQVLSPRPGIGLARATTQS